MILPQPNFLNCPSSQHSNEKKTLKGSKTSFPAEDQLHLKGCFYQYWARKTQAAQEETDVETVFRHTLRIYSKGSLYSQCLTQSTLAAVWKGHIRRTKVLKMVKANKDCTMEVHITNVFLIQFSEVWSKLVFWDLNVLGQGLTVQFWLCKSP